MSPTEFGQSFKIFTFMVTFITIDYIERLITQFIKLQYPHFSKREKSGSSLS